MKNIGFVYFGKLGKKYFWETQLFAVIRDFSDGLTIFNININWDRFESYHSPSFQIEFTIFNLYNHFWIHKINPMKSIEHD